MSRSVNVYCYPYQLTKHDVLNDGPAGVGNSPLQLDGPTMLIWIDLLPSARFAHPTVYVLISDGAVRQVKGNWWPVLNGKQIMYGVNPVMIASPFQLNLESRDDTMSTLLDLMDVDGTLTNARHGLTAETPRGDRSLGNGRYPDTQSYSPSLGQSLFSVNQVDLSILKSNPPQLLIDVLGMASSSGWTNARLHQRVYVQPPADGIWEFDFVADPPMGVSLPLLTPIKPVRPFIYSGNFGSWNGVRIISATNAIEKLLGEPLPMSNSGHTVVELAGGIPIAGATPTACVK